jgi:hypothetical protein
MSFFVSTAGGLMSMQMKLTLFSWDFSRPEGAISNTWARGFEKAASRFANSF